MNVSSWNRTTHKKISAYFVISAHFGKKLGWTNIVGVNEWITFKSTEPGGLWGGVVFKDGKQLYEVYLTSIIISFIYVFENALSSTPTPSREEPALRPSKAHVFLVFLKNCIQYDILYRKLIKYVFL